MAIQIGTVDGLVNITENTIRCFVCAIDEFSRGGVQYAKLHNVPLGAAFQRFVEPVYTNAKDTFDIVDIEAPALTKSGKEQSPARITFCRKMGLLHIEEQNGIFELTPIGREIFKNNISLDEYAFILLTKLGIFKDGVYKENLFAYIAKWFENNAMISESLLLDSIYNKFNDSNVEKTRADIIINALCMCGLVTNISNGNYVLSNLQFADIFNDFKQNENRLCPAVLDNAIEYTDYIGSMRFGIFDILNQNNLSIYCTKYKDLNRYQIMESNSDQLSSQFLQQIFYGAPGTGKSNTVKKTTDKMPEENVFRTTFHPDSDYSTFVGCYKPTKKIEKNIISIAELIKKCNEYATRKGYSNRNLTEFGYDYYLSLLHWYSEEKDFNYGDLLTKAGVNDTSASSYITSGIELHKKIASTIAPITYDFVPQTFTKAYIRAYQTTEPVMLVIEEINRGNCAQIFGDLFQLLDRKHGVSEYPIKPDTDLGNYIAEELNKGCVDGIDETIKNGEELGLPSNLYIWATMNTSDQSLFPIDSAFKRRWEWKYQPIEEGKEKDGKTPLGWQIKIDDQHTVDWWKFVQRINKEVANLTNSEDKQLGYFFCQPDDGKNISVDRFVGKVLFYLWNDVFKDFGYEAKCCKDTVAGKEETVLYADFYQQERNDAGEVAVKVDQVLKFLQRLDAEVDDKDKLLKDEKSDTKETTDENKLPNDDEPNAGTTTDESQEEGNAGNEDED